MGIASLSSSAACDSVSVNQPWGVIGMGVEDPISLLCGERENVIAMHASDPDHLGITARGCV